MKRRRKFAVNVISGEETSNIDVEAGDTETYEDLLAAVGINPETVLVLVDGDPVPLDDRIQEGEISIVRVVSSG